jgi:hypothetical protein
MQSLKTARVTTDVAKLQRAAGRNVTLREIPGFRGDEYED